jgi:hypothetical protein
MARQLTATEKALISAQRQQATYQVQQSQSERDSRTAPVTGTVAGYDPVTGDWLVDTPDGGQIRARSLSNANLSGQRLPIQAFGGSLTAAVDAPPVTNFDAVYASIDEVTEKLYGLISPGMLSGDVDPDEDVLARVDNDLYYNTTDDTLFRWDVEAEEWAIIPTAAGVLVGADAPGATVARADNDLYYSTTHQALWRWNTGTSTWVAILQQASGNGTPASVGVTGYVAGGSYYDTASDVRYYWDGSAWVEVGGGIIYNNGDPNVDAVAWSLGAQVYDTSTQRLFVANPNWTALVDQVRWFKTAPKTWDSTSLAAADAFYVGDLYQGDDGAFYRLSDSGEWILQYVCPDCTEEPTPPEDPCRLAGYRYADEAGDLVYWTNCP